MLGRQIRLVCLRLVAHSPILLFRRYLAGSLLADNRYPSSHVPSCIRSMRVWDAPCDGRSYFSHCGVFKGVVRGLFKSLWCYSGFQRILIDAYARYVDEVLTRR